ncbi:MAG: hypothetical protein HY553_05330 [Elusimicrobia bacterium]|nr:hypothetical protein [Elusimicrobiota bacterium]
MTSRALAAALVFGCATAAAAAIPPVENLLKPTVEREIQTLQRQDTPAAKNRLAEIGQIQSDYMKWSTARDNNATKARADWQKLGSAEQSRLSNRFRTVIRPENVDNLVEELASAPAAEGEDDGSWVDALLDYLERTKPKSRG